MVNHFKLVMVVSVEPDGLMGDEAKRKYGLTCEVDFYFEVHVFVTRGLVEGRGE